MRIAIVDGQTLQRDGNSWAALESFGTIRVYDRSTPAEVCERAAGADVVVTNKARVSAEAIARAAGLRFIAVSATGYDCVDVVAARQRGIPVANVPEYGTDSVAQFTFALLLELCHHVGLHADRVQAGDWSRAPDFCFWKTPEIELAGRTIGIIGSGRIGQRVGAIAHAFGMHVTTHSRTPRSNPGYEPFAQVSLDELLRRADVISLHCPLTPATAGLVDREFLNRVKPGAMLINTSRGGLILEQDLVDALESGRLAAAALDVVSQEPIHPLSSLLTARNCILTPHIAWATTAARRRLLDATIANIGNFLGGRPTNVVNL